MGKTSDLRFGKECLSPRNVVLLYQGSQKTRGKLFLFLVTYQHGRGRVNEKAIHELEVTLIRLASDKNPDLLLNTQGIVRQKLRIKGVLGPSGRGVPSAAAKAFKRMLPLK